MSTGIYVGLSLRPLEQSQRFFDQFRGLSRTEIIDATHITALYPEELASAGLAEWEVSRLSSIAATIVENLGELELVETPIRIDPTLGVKGHKKWWTLTVDHYYEDQIDQVRAIGAEAVEDALNIRLASYSPEGYRISVARRRNEGHDSLRTKVPPPLDWMIDGFVVGVRTAYASYGHKKINRYQNRSPQSL